VSPLIIERDARASNIRVMDRSRSSNKFIHFFSLRWQRFVSYFGRPGAALLITLALMLVASLVFIDDAEKPWGKTVQKRIDKGQHLQAKEYGIIGLWWGAVASAGILTLLLATSKQWMPTNVGSTGQQGRLPLTQGPSMKPAVLWLLTAGALGLATWERLPRMTQSLWNDEEYAMRSYAHGEWELQEDGVRAFEVTTWTHTLFDNDHGNNHLLNSLVMRTSLIVWRAITGAHIEEFSEVVLRLPSLITGLATILLMVSLGLEMGRPRVGVAAAFLMAVSPWHVHYATDAKAYSMMMFFMALNAIAIIRALREDKLRWWLLFALSQAAYLLSFAGSIYVAFMVNLMVLVEIVRTGAWRRVLTLTGFNLIAAVPVTLYMLPSIPQILEYLHSPESLHLGMDAAWVKDFFSNVFAGWSYDSPDADKHLGLGWLIMMKSYSWVLPAFALGVIPVVGLIGFVRAIKAGFAGWVSIVALILAGLMAYGHNYSQNTPMVVWYLVYVLIAAALMLPLALDFHSKKLPWLSPLLITAFVVTYGALTWESNMLKRSHDRQPMRQTIGIIRAEAPEALTAVFGVSDRQVRCYDPHVMVLKNDGDLKGLAAEAREKKLPLYIYFCGDGESTKRHPDVMQYLKGSGEFELNRTVMGLEELFTYRIYRMK